MPVIGFSHYNLRAPRPLLDALRDFYCEIVGLAEGWRPPFTHFGYWLYAGEEAVLHLSEERSGEARSAGTASTFDHAAFRCHDRAEFESRLARLGIAHTLGCVPRTGDVQIFCKDPAGNGVELNFAAAGD